MSDNPIGAAWSDDETGTRLDRAEIVRVSLELLDTQGLDTFSMRRLAQALNIKSPSLYWHVRSKEELYDLIIDTVYGRCALPAQTPDWEGRLTELALSLRKVLLDHPAAARLLPGRVPAGPNALRLADHVVGTMRRAGFDDTYASYGYLILHFYVTGFASQEVAFGKGSAGDVRLADFGAFLSGLPEERYPDLTAVAGVMLDGRLTDRFAFGLEGILARFAREL
ncbi:TetR/AcrR family transcriptional regulator C-terminal domain-containing protein [Phytomonospora sp. NPDC050363]|uniref:TetR/AcrR family transcriptional regulator C-terminal domain-containing protein n=1 Tax=Phytomonospora sp. NPDC050363 TaxID=3155642 RepID=UPI0033E28454